MRAGKLDLGCTESALFKDFCGPGPSSPQLVPAPVLAIHSENTLMSYFFSQIYIIGWRPVTSLSEGRLSFFIASTRTQGLVSSAGNSMPHSGVILRKTDLSKTISSLCKIYIKTYEIPKKIACGALEGSQSARPLMQSGCTVSQGKPGWTEGMEFGSAVGAWCLGKMY